MAWIIGESFDPYNSVADVVASGLWDAVASAGMSSLPAGRIGGKSLTLNTVAYPTLTKSSGSNDAGHHIVLAYQLTTAYPTAGSARGVVIGLLDGTSHQCSILLDANNGNISFYSGNQGTLLGTYAAGTASGAWFGIEIEAVIHNTAGSFKLRLNGNTTEDYTLTNVNTRAGTTNNYANKLQIGIPAGTTGASGYHIDDILWFTTSGAAPNTWVGDIRCETKIPVSTVAGSNLSGSPAPPMTVAPPGTTTTTNWSAPRLLTSDLITLTAGGTLSSVSIICGNTAYTGKYKLAVYDGTAGTPGALLAQTAEQTNIAASTTVSVALISPLSVTVGQKIFTAVILDTAISVMGVIVSGTNGYTVQNSTAYSAGFPSNLGNPALGNTVPGNLGAVFSVVDNSTYVSQITEDADLSFAYSATAGQNDLYNISALSSTPASIIGVQTRLLSRKSDTATRQARIQVKSGTTTSNGSNFTMGTSYTYTNKLDVVDPATSAAWAASAVNNLQVGAYVVA